MKAYIDNTLNVQSAFSNKKHPRAALATKSGTMSIRSPQMEDWSHKLD